MTSRRYEQGGVVSFVIVATVLALLLAAGLWFAKHQTVTTPTPAKVSQTSTPPSSTNNDQSSNSANAGGQTSSTSTSTSSTNSTSSTPSTGPSSVASTGPSNSEVPSTGPKEVLATVVSIAVTSGGIYMFVQSHKRLRLSALK